MRANSWMTCIFFIATSTFLRFLSFHFSVIDHDESTYLIMANAINNGQQLYTDVIDTKPAGIFLIFAMIQTLFGKSIVALRLFSAVILGLSGLFIFRISTRLQLKPTLALFNGLIFIVAFSTYRMGLSINTELYFTFFTILGFSIFQKAFERNQIFLWFLGGLSLGIAFITKYVILAGFGAFCIYFLSLWIKEKKIASSFFPLLISSVGLFTPFLLLHLYFFSVGRFDDFYYATYEIVSRYSSTFSLAGSASFFAKFHMSFLPFIIPFYWALISKRTPSHLKILTVSWYIFAWVMVILPGKDFKHYYLQLLPATSLLIPLGIQFMTEQLNGQRHLPKIIGVLSTVVIVSAVVNQSYFFTQQDIPRSIAKDIKQDIQPTDIIWVDKKYHVTYYLLNLRPPTEFVHPTLMFNHTVAFQIETDKEANRILDQQPAFIIHTNDNNYFLYFERIKEEYDFFKSYGKMVVLKRKPGLIAS